MDELFKQRLIENGVDLEATLNRFMGKEALLLKFLLKFKDDPNFNNLKESLDQEDMEEAFKAAHTLKGVSANLGLTPVSQAVSVLTELLRGKTASEVDMEQVAAQWKVLEEVYQRFINLIEENA